MYAKNFSCKYLLGMLYLAEHDVKEIQKLLLISECLKEYTYIEYNN